ncbi:hypothetical protein BH11VER1_BH11VER1_04460 [soil metagenome]
MSKKSIYRTLALLVIVAIGATAIVLREQHLQKKIAVAQAKKDGKAKAKSDRDKESSDEPTPAPKPAPKVTLLGPAAKAHLAEKAFIVSLRAVFFWRSSQPGNPATNQILMEKLSAITCEDISPNRRSAWQSLLQSWKSTGDSTQPTDPQLQAQIQQATETLNAMFKTHGDGDIVL